MNLLNLKYVLDNSIIEAEITSSDIKQIESQDLIRKDIFISEPIENAELAHQSVPMTPKVQ
jgi:hypothetical protein